MTIQELIDQLQTCGLPLTTPVYVPAPGDALGDPTIFRYGIYKDGSQDQPFVVLDVQEEE